jgi:hypothetical protein
MHGKEKKAREKQTVSLWFWREILKVLPAGMMLLSEKAFLFSCCF